MIQNQKNKPVTTQISNTQTGDLNIEHGILNRSSTFHLKKHHIQLLSKGLYFVPTTHKYPNVRELNKFQFHQYHHKIKLADFFHSGTTVNQKPTPFMPPSQWKPPINKIHPQILELIQQDKMSVKEIPIEQEKSNLTLEEENALKEIQNYCNQTSGQGLCHSHNG